MSGRRSSVSSSRAVTFSFPTLDVKEILECLVEMGASSFTAKDLEKPKREVVEMVFETLLCHCKGMTLEEITQPHFAAYEEVGYPELLEDAVPRFIFARTVQDLLSDCGCTDFGLKDLYKPQPKRFTRQLSAIINYAKYREERIEVFNELFEQRDEKRRVVAERREEVEDLRAKIAAAELAAEAEKPEVDTLKAKCDELQSALREANDRQAVLRGETAEIKKRHMKGKDELAAKCLELTEEYNRTEALQMQIVHSPDRIKQEHVHMDKQKRDEEALGLEVEAQRREMKDRVHTVSKLKKKVETLTQQLARCKEVHQKRKVEKKKLKVLQERLDNQHDLASEMRAQKKMLEKSIQRTSDKLSELRGAAHSKTSSTARSLTSARGELERLQTEHRELSAAYTAAADKKAALDTRRTEAHAKHEASMKDMAESFHSLRSKVTEYQSKLRSTMATA